MSMGSSASYADCVEQSFIEQHAKKNLKAFLKTFDTDKGLSIEQFALNAQYDDLDRDSVTKEQLATYRALQKTFKENTGLDLNMGFHDADENGDKYDEVNGVFWCIENVDTLTHTGNNFKKHISRKQWVCFG